MQENKSLTGNNDEHIDRLEKDITTLKQNYGNPTAQSIEQMRFKRISSQQSTITPPSIIPFKVKYFLRDAASTLFESSRELITQPFGAILIFQSLFEYAVSWWVKLKWTVNPFQSMKLLWDTFVSMLTAMLLFIFSLRIAFQTISIGDSFDSFSLIILYASSVAFLIDIFVELNTGILCRGELIQDKRFILMNYFKGRFIQDFLGLLPIIHFLFYPDDSDYNLIDLFIIFKVKHFVQILQRLDYYLTCHYDKKNLMDLVKLIFMIVITTHCIALLWYRIAIFEKESMGITKTWLDNVTIKTGLTYMDAYYFSYYFATVTIYTIGYGDITPVTILECNFVTITILITGIIFAYAINQIGMIMQNINSSTTILKEDLQTMNKLMKKKNLRMDLRMRIRNYLEHTYSEFQDNHLEDKNRVLKKLSSTLIQEMNENIYDSFILKNKLFCSIFSPDALKTVLSSIEEIIVTPGEYIFKEGENDDSSIFFIFEGKVEISLNQSMISILSRNRENQSESTDSSNSLFQAEVSTQNQELLKRNHSLFNSSKANPLNIFSKKINTRDRKLIELNSFDLNRFSQIYENKQQNQQQSVINDHINEGKNNRNNNNEGKANNRKYSESFQIQRTDTLRDPIYHFGEYNFFGGKRERIVSAQALEFSRVYKLKRAAFVSAIREFSEDFQKLSEIELNISLYSNHSLNGFHSICQACNSQNHDIIQCNQLHYAPSIETVLNQYGYFSIQQRTYFERKQRACTNIFKHLDRTIEFAENYKQNNMSEFFQEANINDEQNSIFSSEKSQDFKSESLNKLPVMIIQNEEQVLTEKELVKPSIIKLINQQQFTQRRSILRTADHHKQLQQQLQIAPSSNNSDESSNSSAEEKKVKFECSENINNNNQKNNISLSKYSRRRDDQESLTIQPISRQEIDSFNNSLRKIQTSQELQSVINDIKSEFDIDDDVQKKFFPQESNFKVKSKKSPTSSSKILGNKLQILAQAKGNRFLVDAQIQSQSNESKFSEEQLLKPPNKNSIVHDIDDRFKGVYSIPEQIHKLEDQEQILEKEIYMNSQFEIPSRQLSRSINQDNNNLVSFDRKRSLHELTNNIFADFLSKTIKTLERSQIFKDKLSEYHHVADPFDPATNQQLSFSIIQMERIKEFSHFFPHNNASTVLSELNAQLDKKREIILNKIKKKWRVLQAKNRMLQLSASNSQSRSSQHKSLRKVAAAAAAAAAAASASVCESMFSKDEIEYKDSDNLYSFISQMSPMNRTIQYSARNSLIHQQPPLMLSPSVQTNLEINMSQTPHQFSSY